MACHLAEVSRMMEVGGGRRSDGVWGGSGVPDEPQNATYDVVCRDSGNTLLDRLVSQDVRAQLLNTCACIHPHPELTVCASPAKDGQAKVHPDAHSCCQDRQLNHCS